jgi:hypothetical protein
LHLVGVPYYFAYKILSLENVVDYIVPIHLTVLNAISLLMFVKDHKFRSSRQ